MPRTTPEEQIRRLEAKIQAIKERAERSKIRANPAIKPLTMALRSLEKALAAADDAVLRKALDEARATVVECLTNCGVQTRAAKGGAAPRGRARGEKLDANRVLEFLQANPGLRSEQISGELDTTAVALRGVLNALIGEGRVRTEGERRGRRYFAKK